MSKRSLPYRLTTLIVAATSLILVLLLMYNYMTTRRIMEHRVQESISTISGTAISQIEAGMQELENLARNYAAFLINRDFSNEEHIRILLEELLERDSQGDARNLYAKAGWLMRFFPVGHTAFGVDYTHSLNLPTGRDEGYSIGAAAVQQFEEFGTEIYMLYRLHALDRDAEPSVHDINVGSIRARVRF